MSYCNIDDVRRKIDDAALVKLTDTAGSGAMDTDRIERAIREAGALIDSYAGKVYAVPMNPVPEVITDLCAVIAIAALFRSRSQKSTVWEAERDRAVEFLEKVARGEAALHGAVPEPAASDDSSAAMFTSAERRFSRETLRDM